MNLYIKNEHGQVADNVELIKMLGIKGSKLPPEGIPPKEVQGIRVWVEHAPSGLDPKTSNGYAHRMIAQCPVCKTVLSAGRLKQHSKVHEGREAGSE